VKALSLRSGKAMEDEREKFMLTAKKSEDFSEWYTQILVNSEFVDYSSVSGMLVYRPDSYFVWESIQTATDRLFKEAGIQNTYFPLLIPERLLMKEKEHVEGFSPEVAWVTQAGKSELSERLAIRPTSETIMYDSFAKWIRSWRDLPMQLNIWNSVVRWEFKHPTPFLRSREFLWNEGHSAFATLEEAEAERAVILGIYQKVLREYLALPGILGRKTDSEKFAGAMATYSIEHVMPDGRVIQGPDHHSDGQNFSRAFEIKFLDRNGNSDYAYQNTYAISTREIGVMVATHSDDKGLVIPPKLARIQAVIVPIYNKSSRDSVLDYSNRAMNALRGTVRAYLDDREEDSSGGKYNQWEMKGVPIRAEIGRRELQSSSVVLVRRDTGQKVSVSFDALAGEVAALLDSIHENLYAKALNFLNSHIFPVESYDEFKKRVGSGFVQSPWCGSPDCEAKVKEETGGKTSNMPPEIQSLASGKKCIYCGKPAKHMVNFARSY